MNQKKVPRRLRPIPRSRYDAAEFWSAKLRQDPEVPRTHTYLAPLLLERAELTGEQGVAAQAMRHLKAACDLDPKNDNARNDFGLALMKVGPIYVRRGCNALPVHST